MPDQQSQHDSAILRTGSAPLASEEGSTIAAHYTTPLPSVGEENSPAGTTDIQASSSSVVREQPSSESSSSASPLVVTITGSSASSPASPTDKTVISKRPPPEPALPPLPTPQSLGQTLVGKTLDHYELIEFVGGGGMGAVFRSIDTRLGRTVAVKVLSRDHTDEETIKRFRNEAQSAARLDHPNIARVYFVGEAEGWNYIVFEYIEGTNLRQIVEARGALPLEEALDYTLQVAEALDHASDRDVVHRDIKPSNVLVTANGQVKLVDMGLARLHQVESSSEDLTASGVMLGTFDYISPEQARDPRSADVRSDIYSLGCTLYFMLAGRPPFPEGTAVQKLLKHSSEEPPDLRLFRPELPAPAATLVGRMLAKRPSQRPQTPQDLIADILSVGQQLGLSGLSRQPSMVVTAPTAFSLWSRVLAIAGPVAALVLVLWLVDSLSRTGERPLDLALRPSLKPPLKEPSTTDASKANNSSAEVDAAKAGNLSRPKGSDIIPGTKTGPTTPAGTASQDFPGTGDTVTSSHETEGSKQANSIATDNGGAGLHADLSAAPPDRASSAGVSSADPLEGQLRHVPSGDSAIASGAAGPNSPSSVPRVIKRVIVRPQGTGEVIVAEDAKVVTSLSQAAALGVSEIELQFNGPLPVPEQPFDVTLPRVRIYAGAGFRPIVVFRPEQFGTERDRQMIRLVGGSRSQVTLQGFELRLELPNDPSSDWSLFALYQIQSLDLLDCVLTVKDTGGSVGTAMLALQPYRPAEMMKMTDDMMAMLPSINVRLTNCVARGEATFLTASEERPLSVVWKQGLLVTPFRLLDSGGSILTKPTPQDKFEIELDHVTAIVPAGLVRQERKGGMASQQRLEIRCYYSLLATDEGSFQFEFGGLPAKDDVKLDFDGNENLYPPRRGMFLRVQTASGSEEFEDIHKWGHGRDSGDTRALWKAPAPPSLGNVPAHEHIPAFYQPDVSESENGGFDLALMRAVLDRPSSADSPSPAAAGTEADFFPRSISP